MPRRKVLITGASGLIVLMALCDADSTSADDWPQWRCPRRDAVSTETGLLQSWPAGGPKVAWKAAELGTGYSSVVVGGSRLFTMGHKESDVVVTALDAATGTGMWTQKIGETSRHPCSTPTLDDGYLYEPIPTLFAEAHTSAPTPRSLFEGLVNELLERIETAGPVDGVLLELHGSMCAGDLDGQDAVPDAEGFILTEIRRIVGPDVPILAELDIHSNVTPLMVDMADVLIGRRSYPEIDIAERARQCADVLVRIWQEGLRPTMALHQIPMVWGMNQVTAHSPMREAIAELQRIEAHAGVVCGSITTCYFLADCLTWDRSCMYPFHFR